MTLPSKPSFSSSFEALFRPGRLVVDPLRGLDQVVVALLGPDHLHPLIPRQLVSGARRFPCWKVTFAQDRNRPDQNVAARPCAGQHQCDPAQTRRQLRMRPHAGNNEIERPAGTLVVPQHGAVLERLLPMAPEVDVVRRLIDRDVDQHRLALHRELRRLAQAREVVEHACGVALFRLWGARLPVWAGDYQSSVGLQVCDGKSLNSMSPTGTTQVLVKTIAAVSAGTTRPPLKRHNARPPS